MDKSQGQVQAGAIPVKRGGGGTLYFRGDTLLRSKASGGGGTLYYGVVYFVIGRKGAVRRVAYAYYDTLRNHRT